MGTILERWSLTAEELTTAIDENPSLRGMLLGYVAEYKLRTMWFTGKPNVSHYIKHDDHNRKQKGDLVATYHGHPFIIESKSLQTHSIRREGNLWTGKAQCDASDRRTVTLTDGSTLETTCLLAGEFDILAVNLFAFENKWRFVFAKNQDLPRSTYKKYTPQQQAELLASLVPVSWPPRPPFSDEPFSLLDDLLKTSCSGDSSRRESSQKR
ncbi:MAG: restriction endonuclease [Pirellulaceae bacterium]|nr:restriction endonuclease [Pirellulaceae bacterium]